MRVLLLARFVGFVAVHAGLVHVYVGWLCDVLPPLRAEPPSLVLVPATVIAIVAFAGMYPLVREARTHVSRAAILAGFSAAAMLALALWTALHMDSSEPLALVGTAAFVLVAEAFYGAPLLVAIALTAKVLSPVLVARPVGGRAEAERP